MREFLLDAERRIRPGPYLLKSAAFFHSEPKVHENYY